MRIEGGKAKREEIVSFEQLLNSISEERDIVIYGAGANGKMLEWCLKKKQRTIKMFLVTRIGGAEPRQIDSVPVFSVGEVEWDFDNTTFIIATNKRIPRLDMMDVLIERNVKDIIMLNTELEDSIRETYLSGQLLEGTFPYRLLTESVGEPNFYVIGGLNSSKYRWRIHKDHSLPLSNFHELWQNDLLDLFEHQYGKYQSLYDYEFKKPKGLKKEYVYAAKSYVDKVIMDTEKKNIVQYVQAGAALTQQKICELTDDVGDNISIKNKNYSECTVLYWIWKHIKDVHYIGLCHYRRIFDLPFDDLLYLEGTGIDIIVTTPTICNCAIKDYFVRRWIGKFDWNYMMEGILNYDKNIYNTAVLYEKCHFYPPCNLMIMRQEVFDKYCNFAFGVAEYIEVKYQSQGIKRPDRYMGYLFENLLAIFMMHFREIYSIAYANMQYLQ